MCYLIYEIESAGITSTISSYSHIVSGNNSYINLGARKRWRMLYVSWCSANGCAQR